MVSKTEIKVGDIIECIPEGEFTFKGAHSDEPNGGSGYWEGRVMVVGRISEGVPAEKWNVYFPAFSSSKPTTSVSNSHGVYAYAVRKLENYELSLELILHQIKQEVNQV